jgi:hypothetical protein
MKDRIVDQDDNDYDNDNMPSPEFVDDIVRMTDSLRLFREYEEALVAFKADASKKRPVHEAIMHVVDALELFQPPDLQLLTTNVLVLSTLSRSKRRPNHHQTLTLSLVPFPAKKEHFEDAATLDAFLRDRTDDLVEGEEFSERELRAFKPVRGVLLEQLRRKGDGRKPLPCLIEQQGPTFVHVHVALAIEGALVTSLKTVNEDVYDFDLVEPY